MRMLNGKIAVVDTLLPQCNPAALHTGEPCRLRDQEDFFSFPFLGVLGAECVKVNISASACP